MYADDIGHDEGDDIAGGILQEIKIAHDNIALSETAISQHTILKQDKEKFIPNLKLNHAHSFERVTLLAFERKTTTPYKHNTKADVDIRNHVLAEENKTNDEIRAINTAISDAKQTIKCEQQTLEKLNKKWDENAGPFTRGLEQAIKATGVERKRYVLSIACNAMRYTYIWDVSLIWMK
jgi:hypothetical protein